MSHPIGCFDIVDRRMPYGYLSTLKISVNRLISSYLKDSERLFASGQNLVDV